MRGVGHAAKVGGEGEAGLVRLRQRAYVVELAAVHVRKRILQELLQRDEFEAFHKKVLLALGFE